jgi:hypothetical protein
MQKRWKTAWRRFNISTFLWIYGHPPGYCIAPAHDLPDSSSYDLRRLRTVHDLSSRIERFSTFAYIASENIYRGRCVFLPNHKIIIRIALLALWAFLYCSINSSLTPLVAVSILDYSFSRDLSPLFQDAAQHSSQAEYVYCTSPCDSSQNNLSSITTEPHTTRQFSCSTPLGRVPKNGTR